MEIGILYFSVEQSSFNRFLFSDLSYLSLLQIERYTVGGLHSAPVTALEWSTNGQKLFSGDATGLVVFTEIDFYMVTTF